MRSNASLFAVLLLLAGCGGRSYYDYGAEDAPPPPQRSEGLEARPPGASYQAPDLPPEQRDLGTRPADQYRPQREAQPQPAPAYSPPADTYSRPADAYDRPAYSQPAPQSYPPQSYSPDPQAADPGAGMPGPRGSSQPGAGEERYDEVGYAGVRGVAGGDANGGAVVAVARSLPADTIVEVTSIDTGKTILVLVTGSMGPGADHLIDLSPGAARLLGGGGGALPVRVRRVIASPQDQNLLRSGQPASERADTPPVLLSALRRHLPSAAAPVAYAPAPAAPSRAPARPAPATRGGGYFVQVAALSNGGNAQGLAQSMGGFVKAGGGLYRVQLGPFRTAGEAEAARADAARRGYGDARVFTQN